MPDPCQHSKSGKAETSPSGKPRKARILNTGSTSFPPHPRLALALSLSLSRSPPSKGKVVSWCFLLITSSCAGLEEGLLWVKWNGFLLPFQCSLSWLCACLRYCSLLTGFWSSQKGFLDHKLLSQSLFGRTRSEASFSTMLLTSLWILNLLELWDL